MTDPTNIANRMGFNMEDMNKRRDQQAKNHVDYLTTELVHSFPFTHIEHAYCKGFDDCKAEMQAQNASVHKGLLEMLNEQRVKNETLKAQLEHHKQCCDLYSQRNLRLVKEIELLNRELEALGVSINTYDKINDRLKAQLEMAKKGLNNISDSCQCETDDRDICFDIAVKTLAKINQLDKSETDKTQTKGGE